MNKSDAAIGAQSPRNRRAIAVQSAQDAYKSQHGRAQLARCLHTAHAALRNLCHEMAVTASHPKVARIAAIWRTKTPDFASIAAPEHPSSGKPCSLVL